MNSNVESDHGEKRDTLLRVLEILLVALLSAMIVLVVVQVLARYVFQRNVKGVEEMARLALVWGCFLGSAYAVLKGKHIVVDFVLESVSKNVSAALEVFTLVASAAVGVVMITAGVRFTVSKWVYPDLSTALLYPRSLFFLPVPILGIATVLHSVFRLVAPVIQKRRRPQ